MVFKENGVVTFTSHDSTQCVRFTSPLEGQLNNRRASLTWGVQGNILSQQLLVNGKTAIPSLPTGLNRTSLDMDQFTPPYVIELRVVPGDTSEGAIVSSTTLGGKLGVAGVVAACSSTYGAWVCPAFANTLA